MSALGVLGALAFLSVPEVRELPRGPGVSGQDQVAVAELVP